MYVYKVCCHVCVLGSYLMVPNPGIVTVPSFSAALPKPATVRSLPAALASWEKREMYRHAERADAW